MVTPYENFDRSTKSSGNTRVDRISKRRMCLVAEARFDCMLTFRRAFEWDIAAGALIASEAGAQVTDGNGGRLVFNSAEGMQEGVIAAPSSLHDRLMGFRQ